MWIRLRERLLSGVAMVLMLVWLGGAVGIAVWLVDATGLEVRRRGALGLVFLIYIAPVALVVAVDELVIRRVKHGPPVPGRHTRGTLDPDRLRALDERLKRRSDGSSEAPRTTTR